MKVQLGLRLGFRAKNRVRGHSENTMYADRVEAVTKRSIRDRLNGNTADDFARRRQVTGKRFSPFSLLFRLHLLLLLIFVTSSFFHVFLFVYMYLVRCVIYYFK